MRSVRGLSKNEGQSLIELLIAIGITSIIAGSAVGALLLAVRINKESVRFKTASSLAEEITNKLQSMSEASWVSLYSLELKDESSTYIIFSEDTIVASDQIGEDGRYSTLDLDDFDYPVIAYNAYPYDLEVMHCNDKSCSGSDENIESVDTGSLYNSLELDSSGNPVVAHYNATDEQFRIVHCDDPNCSGGNESIVTVSTGEPIGGLSLELNSAGNPIVSFQLAQGKKLGFLACDDPNCVGDSIITVDQSWSVAEEYTSLALADGDIPVIAFAGGGGDLWVARCNDPDCSGGDEDAGAADGATGASFISVDLDSNEYPVISYHHAGSDYDLRVVHCNDIACSGDDESSVTVDSIGKAGQSTSLRLDSAGRPVVSYISDLGVDSGELKILHCNDPNCEGGNESIVTVTDANPQANISGTSLRLDSAGNPVVSYFDDDQNDLKVIHCDDPNCEDGVSTALDVASGTEDIMVDGTTYTRWFSVEDVNRDSGWNIVESGGIEDPSTQKITVHVEWKEGGDTASVTHTQYLTRWYRNESALFTNWGGSSGVDGPVTFPTPDYYATSGDINVSSSGEIKLSE